MSIDVKGNEYFRDNRSFNVNYPDNYGYNSHASNYTKYFQRYEGKINEDIANQDIYLVKKFYGNLKPFKKIFFSKNLNYENIVDYVKDSDVHEKNSNFNYEVMLEKFDGNKIEINIITENDGWLAYIDNWDHGWQAYINGNNAKIEKLLGSYKAVYIKKGFSNIKFHYKPW